MRDNIVNILKRLPPAIYIGDYAFEFTIFINGENDVRVAYALRSHSSWENIYQDNHTCDFLYLQGGISNDLELETAIFKMYRYLLFHDIIKPAQ